MWDEVKLHELEDYLSQLLVQGGCLLTLYDGAQLAAFAALSNGTINSCVNLAMFFVHDAYQRRGLGRCLFEAYVDALEDRYLVYDLGGENDGESVV